MAFAKLHTRSTSLPFMSYMTIVELSDLVAAEQEPERKMALLEELRKLLNEEKEMLQANLQNFFPRVDLSHQSHGDESNEKAKAHTFREHAEALKMKALDLLQEAGTLMMRADRADQSNQANDPVKSGKAKGHAA